MRFQSYFSSYLLYLDLAGCFVFNGTLVVGNTWQGDEFAGEIAGVPRERQRVRSQPQHSEWPFVGSDKALLRYALSAGRYRFDRLTTSLDGVRSHEA